jgi:hypothetical protein
VWLAAVEAPATEKVWTFEEGQVGVVPKHWKEAKTGEAPGSVWRVVADESAPSGSKALAQMSSDGPRPLFNLCVFTDASYRNVDLSLRFKAVCGVIDQGGGPVWRYQDADNYYVARANPLESNFRVYKVHRGKRIQLDSADVDVPAGRWHELRVEHEGDRVRCYLNDRMFLDVTDATIPNGGRIGLWTKADAVTLFDDLRARERD